MTGRRALISKAFEITLEDVEICEGLKSNEVLIETEWTFISAGTEIANFTGLDQGVHTPGAWNAYPHVPGFANCGRVVDCGSDVRGIERGQRVFSQSPHVSHQVLVPEASDLVVVPIPDDVSSDVAAAIRMGLVSMTALQTADFDLNDYVAIFGLGLVGNIAAQLFNLAGARVIGVDPRPTRCTVARNVGVEQVIAGEADACIEQLWDLSSGGVRVAVDAVGDAGIVASAVRCVRPYGEVIVLGSPRREFPGDLNAFLKPVHYEWVTIKGALEHKIPRNPGPGIRYSVAANAATVLDLVRCGRLRLGDLLSHRMDIQDIASAYEGLLNEPDVYWGVALDWTAKET